MDEKCIYKPRRTLIRRFVLSLSLLGIVILLTIIARPGWHLWRTARHDVDEVEAPPSGYSDDASRLNLTAVRDVWHAPADRSVAESELADLLREARQKGWKVAVAGARHSMGGHTMYPDGIVIDMLPLAHMALDESTNTLHVGAGALWHDVLAYLDARGRSVAVMQSNDSFSVGGSISVNCHGWQVGRPPIAATVRSLRLMLADGSIVQCSREENADLFSAALGGYGLFGIILDVQLEVVPNRRYRLERHVVESARLPASWDEEVAAHAEAEMAYGRLNVIAEHFLQDAILYVLYVDPDLNGQIPQMHEPSLSKLKRQVFRGSAESEYGKRLRWQAEIDWQPKLGAHVFSRNQLLSEGVEVFQNRSADTTDILHEYFVPRPAFDAFLARSRATISRHGGDLLNVTVRSIEIDKDTLLRYADQPMFSLVMLFQQRRDEDGNAKMAAMTRELIDAALKSGGRYYLPYRLHATSDQFHRAYPKAVEFFALKRKYDPQELFQNQFYLKYGNAENSTASAD